MTSQDAMERFEEFDRETPYVDHFPGSYVKSRSYQAWNAAKQESAAEIEQLQMEVNAARQAERESDEELALFKSQSTLVVSEDDALRVYQAAKSKWMLENQNLALESNYQTVGEIMGIRALLTRFPALKGE